MRCLVGLGRGLGRLGGFMKMFEGVGWRVDGWRDGGVERVELVWVGWLGGSWILVGLGWLDLRSLDISHLDSSLIRW